jgi:hypothetical protein
MDGKDLAQEAVKDVKSMVDLAVAAAKTELVESLTPELKKLIEQKLRGGSKKNEDTDRVRRIKDGYPGESKNEKFEEGAMNDDDKLQDESLASFFAPVTETEDEEPVDESVDQVAEGSEDDEMPTSEGAEQVEETLEISEDAIRAVYEAALKTEVQVKKGFGEMTKGGDFGKDKPDSAGGIADLKSGEQQWADSDVPAAQDWTVKEVKQMIARGIAENKALRERCAQLEGYCRKLNELAEAATKKLTEVNLFNAKLYHAQSFMNEHRSLTKEQRDFVISKLDKAKTVKEVKSAYDTIVESFKVARGLNESVGKKPMANSQRPRKAGGPSQEVLSESVDKSNGGYWSRAQQLAGLKNLK